jgi:hypothetical protein
MRRRAWSWLIASSTGALLFWSLLHNWQLHARFMLLLNGYAVCQLAAPGPDAALIQNTNRFVAFTVYRHGELVGTLDTYGQFIPTGLTGPNANVLEMSTVALFVGFWCCVVVLLTSFALALFRVFFDSGVTDMNKT